MPILPHSDDEFHRPPNQPAREHPLSAPARVLTWRDVLDHPRECPEPTARASAALVAHWLRQLEIENGEDFTNASVIGLCGEREIEPLPVLVALRDERSGVRAYTTADITFTIDEVHWEEMRANRETACCPIPSWVIGAVTGRQMYRFENCNDSWRCPKHAHRRADRVLMSARSAWADLDVVYYAMVVDDLKAINRVRSTRRAGRKAATNWWIKRRGWKGWKEVTFIHFFSNKDLAGPRTTKPPLSWEALLPEEALERLAEALRLPGPTGCQPHWADAQGAEDAADGDESATDDEQDAEEDVEHDEKFISLPSVMPENRDEIMELACRLAELRWGFKPSPEFFPTDQATVEEWVELILGATKVIRAQRRKKS